MILTSQTVLTDLHNLAPQGVLVRPSDDRTYPGIVLIQEWWGLEPHIRELANRLASEGFVVLVPDLYHGEIATEPDDAQKLVMAAMRNMEIAIGEIQAALQYLRNNAGVKPKKLGIMGFCMGGFLTFKTAEREPDLGAISPWYPGRYDPTPEDVAKVAAPVLAIFGENDGGIPVPHVKKVEALYAAADKEAEFRIYPNAGHAFNNPDHGMYSDAAATDAWARAVAFFKDKLK